MKKTQNKASKFLKEKRITPLQLIFIVGGLLYFVFQETSIFGSIDAFYKVIAYASIMTITAILGVSFINMAKMAEKISDIYNNPNLTAAQKEKEYMKIALVILDKIGEIFEESNGVIETNPEVKPIAKVEE